MLKIKSVVSRYRPRVSIRYKENEHKVLSFIDIENIRTTKSSIPYLSYYPYSFAFFSF